MSKQLSIEPILANSIILTPNRRIAEWLKIQYSNTVKQKAYFAPNIITLQYFFEQTWQKIAIRTAKSNKHLLSTYQAHYLWKQCFIQSQLTELQHSLMSSIWEAWRLLQLYYIKPEQLKHFASNQDQLLFADWAQQMAQYYENHHLLDQFTVVPYLSQFSNEIADILENKTIKLYAFLDYPPAYNDFFSKLGQCGLTIEQITIKTIPTNPVQYVFKEEADEFKAMIDWCKINFASGKKIACIVPNINHVRFKIRRHLARYIPTPPLKK